MTRAFSPGLFRLELRRAAIGVALPAALLLAAVLGLRPDASGVPGELAAGPGRDPGALARGMLREDAWRAALLVLVPLAAFHAARIPGRWRRGAADWMGSRPLARGTAILSSQAGLAVALLGTLLLVAVAIEQRAGAGGHAPRLIGQQALARTVRLEPGEATTVVPADATLTAARRHARAGPGPTTGPTTGRPPARSGRACGSRSSPGATRRAACASSRTARAREACPARGRRLRASTAARGSRSSCRRPSEATAS